MVNFLSDSGRLVMIGTAPGKFEFHKRVNLFGTSGKILKTTQGGKTNPSADIPRYVRTISGEENRLWQHSYAHFGTLGDVSQALDVLRSGNAGRVMVKW